MQLANSSLSNGLRDRTRYLTRTDTNTYKDIDLNANLNSWNHIFTTEVLAAMDGWDFGAETATTNLVSGQQEYVVPTDLLKIKRVEITYDGTTWQKVEFFDINERSNQTNDLSDFQKTEPYADLMDDSLFIYPIPDAAVTDGLKIWYSKLDATMTADADTPGIAEPFHIGLCYGAAKDYYERHSEKPNFADRAATMTRNLNDTIEKMKEFYNTHNQERDYILKPIVQDYNDDYNA